MGLHLSIAWLLAGILAIVHFIGAEINQHEYISERRLAAFAAGVTATYVIVQLLPEHHKGIEYLGQQGVFFTLLGFSVLHLTKIFIYQHAKTMEEVLTDYKEMHSVFLFLYYLAIGIILNNLLTRSVLEGALFFIPVLLHTSISSLALGELHEDILNNLWVKLGVSGAVLLGVGMSQFIGLGLAVFHALLATVTGMFFYIAIHDSMPDKEDGAPFSFIAGMLLYSGIIAYTWTLL